MVYRAEYIWIDGTEPTPLMRSKTKILPDGADLPIWGFDGSSTNQAPGSNSDVVLRPVFDCPDPLRGGDDRLVLAECLLPESMEPHATNTRAPLAAIAEQYASHESLFGIEQEYTFFQEGRPLGWPENGGFPGPQGPYYCGVGATEIAGRDIVEAHTTACMEAGLAISGTNAEVMLGQWEFQIGPVGPLEVGDQMWMARYLLFRIAEDFGVDASIVAKPIKGDWNGAGAHTNYSTKAMRENYEAILGACEALGAPGKPEEHLAGYGVGYEERLTGLHETAHFSEFRYGVSDRGASVRIPWQVKVEGKGYIEDRRPNANMDPYTVARLMTETVCAAEAKAGLG
ncbi:MAG: glutamine synthetase GlnII [Actinomycetota bacterium]|nr:glutamine synthetase GlnII [Actinomycetota bacterium]